MFTQLTTLHRGKEGRENDNIIFTVYKEKVEEEQNMH